MMTKIIEVSVMEAQMESVQMTSISYYRTKIAIMKINNNSFLHSCTFQWIAFIKNSKKQKTLKTENYLKEFPDKSNWWSCRIDKAGIVRR